MTNNHKIQKILDLTCHECLSTYQLLETSDPGLRQNQCSNQCLANWKHLLHSHFQEQIILHLAQKEKENEEKENDQNDPDHD